MRTAALLARGPACPLIEQNDDGSWPQTNDMYEAGSWTLTAHEARPGLNLQYR